MLSIENPKCGDKIILLPFDLHSGNSCTVKIASLNWNIPGTIPKYSGIFHVVAGEGLTYSAGRESASDEVNAAITHLFS